MKARMKMLCMCMIMLIVFSASGCQLAHTDEEQKKESKIDKLVGIYITFDDMHDTEDIFSGRDISEKVYASLVQTEHDGVRTLEYVFEEHNGIPFYNFSVPEEVSDDYELGLGFNSHLYGNEITEVSEESSVDIDGDRENISLEGKLYITEEKIIYCNPVFQEADGDVYFVPDDMGQYVGNIEATLESSICEEYKGGSTRVELACEKKGITEQINILYMNSNDEVIGRDVYELETLPEKLEVLEGTEWIAVKNIFAGEEEEQIDVYTNSDGNIEILVPTENNFLCMEYTELIWEN